MDSTKILKVIGGLQTVRGGALARSAFTAILFFALGSSACAQSDEQREQAEVEQTLRAVERLGSRDTRELFILQIASRGPSSAQLWKRLLSHRDNSIVHASTLALARSAGRQHWRTPSPIVLEALTGATGHKDPEIRSQAIQALANLHPDDPDVARTVLRCVTDQDSGVQKSALSAFRILGPAASIETAKALLAALPGDHLGWEAAVAASACGLAPPKVLDALVLACRDGSNVESAMIATQAIGRLGRLADSAALPLSEAIEGAPPPVARELALAVGLLGNGGEAVMKSLSLASQSTRDGVSQAAALSLVRLGKNGKEIEAILRGGLRSSNGLIAAISSEGVLILSEDAVAWSCLERFLRDPLELAPTRAFSANALLRRVGAGQRPPETVLAALEQAKGDRDIEVRRAAGQALSSFKK